MSWFEILNNLLDISPPDWNIFRRSSEQFSLLGIKGFPLEAALKPLGNILPGRMGSLYLDTHDAERHQSLGQLNA